VDVADETGARSSVVINTLIGLVPLVDMPCFVGFAHVVRYDFASSRSRIIASSRSRIISVLI
jgi:hypothetical protein